MARPTEGRTTKNLTDEERARIFELAEQGCAVGFIAGEVGRCEQTVYRFLASVKGTGKIARAYAEGQSFRMMRRVVKDADVEQTLEVLDRTGVLEAKRDKRGSGGPSVVVCVGMPGAPALSPPSYEAVARALTGTPELVVVGVPVPPEVEYDAEGMPIGDGA